MPKDLTGTRDTLAIILGGGQGTRLFPLTEMRAKPAVPLGGKYRLIDIPVSNCINSDIIRIFVLTQFNSASLNRHIFRTYRFSRFSDGFVEVLAAEQTPGNKQWFQGTADAVRQNLAHLQQWKHGTILILSGDHLYRMDYRKFLERHFETGADLTISVIPCAPADATGFGLLKTDESGRVVEFREKPPVEELEEMMVDTTRFGLSAEQALAKPFIASMGIYVFRREALAELLGYHESAVDFGREFIPEAIKNFNVQAYLFTGYWEDIGTIPAFHKANIDMTRPLPDFNFFDAEAPIYTRPRFLPGSKVLKTDIEQSIIAEGCIINDAKILQSIIGIRSRVEHGAVLEDTLMMGADFYQTLDELAQDQAANQIRIGVGRNSHIRRAIIDKNARIGSNVKLLNEGKIENFDGPGFFIREGIIVVPKNGVVADGTEI
ncbi:MAG TPA: glucose-1-phosphate adenylyltransferase [Blastocatellia bacterium]|nr:glucose-1-phosphate adenylyltransferase [Blastocatellia bacterium]